MLSKTSKILLGVYVLLLILIFLPFSEGAGSILLLITGLFILITSIFLANNIKILKNSKTSKIFSIILINLVLYLTAILIYSLGFIGMGDKGLLAGFTIIFYSILLGLSILIGIILVVVNKKQAIQYKPNKTLSIILAVVLIILFYSTAISGIARLTNSPGICSMHIGIKEDSFIFRNSFQDSCNFRVSLDNSNVAYCKRINSESQMNKCILNVARNLEDKNICSQIINDPEIKGSCIEYIAGDSKDISMCKVIGIIDKDACYYRIARGEREGDQNPEICNYIKNNESKYHCYSIIAIDKRDTSICEKYFPTNEVLIQEGVSPDNYSKEECIIDAQKGSFN